MRKIWKIKQCPLKLVREFSESLNIPSLIAQILINRGITSLKEAEDFTNCQLSSLYEPSLLKGLPEALRRIKRAIANKDKVLVFGDYDVDGLTATALMMRLLKPTGLEVLYQIPLRLNQGYGLNEEVVKQILERKVNLLITVDCGIGSFEEIRALKNCGVDTIVIDHHQPSSENLPQAYAIIDPKRKSCPYPYKDLSAVGLVYKLGQALTKSILEEELDLVCLGTVADVVPVNGENRILLKYGLTRLSQTKKAGLSALIEISGLKRKDLSYRSVGYILAPRINAPGRIAHAEEALKLLLTESSSEAREIAKQLDFYNRSRQKIEEQIFQEALAKIEREVNFKVHRVIVIHNKDWHPGVIGIVASKLAERFYRPTIVISLKGQEGRGSARSIENFHLMEALKRCRMCLESYGGHARAAGLKILKERIEDFKEMINSIAQQVLNNKDLLPTLLIDADIPLGSLFEESIRWLETLGPFGEGNLEPLILSRALKLKAPPQLNPKGLLKIWVTDGKKTFEAIGFGIGHLKDLLSQSKKIDLVYKPMIDNWEGQSRIVLKIKDLRTSC